MIVNQNISEDVKTLGDIEENRVGIDRSNIDFITTLLTSNLYSKPLESFLRETVSNAYDSHVEAGTDEHILLLIEDDVNKNTYTSKAFNISIRDYGVGVSPERFEKIYRNIGSSTKRESNDYIGMFGIGRFSCLSCADVANINSYYNGTKYSYLIYKNGSGINIDKVSETEGDYKNGLEVSISYSVPNISVFTKAITKLCLFDKLWIEYQGNNPDLKEMVKAFNNRVIQNYDTFSICDIVGYDSALAYNNYFKIGRVLYEITDVFQYSNRLCTKLLLIDIPVGSVGITPNRENLQLTESSKSYIDGLLFKEIGRAHV